MQACASAAASVSMPPDGPPVPKTASDLAGRRAAGDAAGRWPAPGPRAPSEAWQQFAEAQAGGDLLRLGAAAQALAALWLARQDPDEARWHLERARAALAAAPASPRAMALHCDGVALAAALSRQCLAAGDAIAARRHADEARDAGFDAVRRSAALDDVACAVAALLRVADALDQLGDQADAQRLRLRAFRGLGRGSTRGG